MFILYFRLRLYMKTITHENLLNRNVVPLFFEANCDNEKDPLPEDRHSIGTAFIIGALGKNIIVATAGHVLEEARNIKAKYEKNKKLSNLFPPDYKKIETQSLENHEVSAYVKVDEINDLSVRFCANVIFQNYHVENDLGILYMQSMNNDYEHITQLKINFKVPHIGLKLHVFSYKNTFVHKISSCLLANPQLNYTHFYKVTKEINNNYGEVIEIYQSKENWVRGQSFRINSNTDGGNSGGLVYYMQDNEPIVIGLISASKSNSSNSNEGQGETIVSSLNPILKKTVKFEDGTPLTYKNLSKTYILEYFMDFIALDVIQTVNTDIPIYIDEDEYRFILDRDTNTFKKYKNNKEIGLKNETV